MRKFTANIHGLQGLAHVEQREAKTPKGFTVKIWFCEIFVAILHH